MAELAYTWEWQANGALKIITPLLPAIRTIPGTTKEVFFNQMVAQIANARDFSSREQDSTEKPLTEFLQDFLRFGDGSVVPTEPLEFAHRLCENCAIELQWQAGDVALLDNYAVMHARRAFEGKRRVLASLVQ
jgi:alpha-ketoglutarate-dependent taurine dioxygenase